jgi:hypothetical protein
MISFLTNFAKRPFTVNEQVKLIHEFLEVSVKKGGKQCRLQVMHADVAINVQPIFHPVHRWKDETCRTMERTICRGIR